MNNIISKSRQSNFSLIFPKLPQQNSLDDSLLQLNLKSTVLPNVSISTIDTPILGKHNFSESGEIEFEQWRTSFQIDQEWINYNIIFDWMCKGILDGKEKYASLKNTYQIDGELIIYDNWKNVINSFILKRLWPISLGGVDLSYESGEQILNCDITFVYDYFEKSE